MCGKTTNIRNFDPESFEDDIYLVRFRGLGRGRGFEIASKESLLEGLDPELLDKISDRIEILYNILYEDTEEEADHEEFGFTEEDWKQV